MQSAKQNILLLFIFLFGFHSLFVSFHKRFSFWACCYFFIVSRLFRLYSLFSNPIQLFIVDERVFLLLLLCETLNAYSFIFRHNSSGRYYLFSFVFHTQNQRIKHFFVCIFLSFSSQTLCKCKHICATSNKKKKRKKKGGHE